MVDGNGCGRRWRIGSKDSTPGALARTSTRDGVEPPPTDR
uniref:Uncharacterized protein n=1 Tax=Arundo donax TaxID=35708 RepID=A0A0A8Z276_ARUDO